MIDRDKNWCSIEQEQCRLLTLQKKAVLDPLYLLNTAPIEKIFVPINHVHLKNTGKQGPGSKIKNSWNTSNGKSSPFSQSTNGNRPAMSHMCQNILCFLCFLRPHAYNCLTIVIIIIMGWSTSTCQIIGCNFTTFTTQLWHILATVLSLQPSYEFWVTYKFLLGEIWRKEELLKKNLYEYELHTVS